MLNPEGESPLMKGIALTPFSSTFVGPWCHLALLNFCLRAASSLGCGGPCVQITHTLDSLMVSRNPPFWSSLQEESSEKPFRKGLAPSSASARVSFASWGCPRAPWGSMSPTGPMPLPTLAICTLTKPVPAAGGLSEQLILSRKNQMCPSRHHPFAHIDWAC